MSWNKTIKHNLILVVAKIALIVFVMLGIYAGINNVLSGNSLTSKRDSLSFKDQNNVGISVFAQGLVEQRVSLYTTKCSWILRVGDVVEFDEDDYPEGDDISLNDIPLWRNTCQRPDGSEYPGGPNNFVPGEGHPPACNPGDREIRDINNASFINCYPEDVSINVFVNERTLPNGQPGWGRYNSWAINGACERQCLHQPEYWY